jgi:type IV pilus assembly protein PilQ
LQLELTAAETEGATKIISSPRVITGNQQAATILQGTEIPYRTLDAQGAGQTMFKNAVLELNVTPQITPDDRIIMELNVKSDKVSQIVNDGNLAIDKREVKTKVLVDNGETLVLGGIYEQENRDSITRVPFFGDLPLVGMLFRSKSNQEDRRELLIFVTPKIVREST